MRRFARRLLRAEGGAAIIEFGILAPVIITLMIGTLQTGLWMQKHNALRSIAADTRRYVAVEYQRNNRISNIEMAVWARDHAISDYLFDGDLLSTRVEDAGTQNITGVTEKTLRINYTMESFLPFGAIGDIPVTFERPIFVKST